MDAKNLDLACGLVPAGYIRQAADALNSRRSRIRNLLAQRRLPECGWDESNIEWLVQELALMDSNNFPENVGGGEREARIHSSLVRRRHYGLGHGIGRSGDLAEVQPKAAGSSLMVQLAGCLALDLLRCAGATRTAACFVLPVATGMALVLCLLTLWQKRPQAKYVVWPRMDQKSCLKAMLTAGLEVVVADNVVEGDEVCTDLAAVGQALDRLGDQVLAVVCTTSCFAPRAPDRVVELAQLAQARGVALVVNNAYGVQAGRTMHAINEAMRLGRVDLVVSSTDKNLLVPVGGALLWGPDSHSRVADVCKAYPGRASGGPALDVLLTLLGMGSSGYKALLQARKEVYVHLRTGLETVAARHGLRLLHTPSNPISLGITLPAVAEGVANDSELTMLGSMLFARGVSGTRVVSGRGSKDIGGLAFDGYGAHVGHYPTPYLTAAAALGMTKAEADTLLARLDSTLQAHAKRQQQETPSGPQ